MTCGAGVCTPTAPKANLRVTELADMLASGDIKIVADSKAEDIRFAAPLSWTSTSRLTLDAYESITIEQALTVAGKGALTIKTEDGGSSGDFWFPGVGHVEFWDTKSALSINGKKYKLVNTLGQLAKAVLKNESGAFALAKSYDASKDGVYAHSPVHATMSGDFEGLGNAISNVTIDDAESSSRIGLFDYAFGVHNLYVTNINITAHGTSNTIGGIAGSGGGIDHTGVSGSIIGSGTIGGLAGTGSGFSSSFSNVNVTVISGFAGGLVGHPYAEDAPVISGSFATGSVTGGDDAVVGGLVGVQERGWIVSSYATGPVTGGARSCIGGLIGFSFDYVLGTYSTGAVAGGSDSQVGGLLCGATGGGFYGSDYWDTETSGTNQGTGNGNYAGVTGLTTKQFKSGLPEGLEPPIWAEKKTINNGYPYLLGNPPR